MIAFITDESKLFKVLAMEWMEDRKAVIKEATYLRDLSVLKKIYSLHWATCPLIRSKGKMYLHAKKIEARGAQENTTLHSFSWAYFPFCDS
jgi:hypothetical protein